MHKLTFFPIGNADSILIELEAGRLLLFDYADMRNPDDSADKRIDLADAIGQRLKAARREALDVVAITHLDDDHICGSTDFFRLDHDKKYQGAGRIRITELWVPAAVITEDRQDLSEEARVVQREARYRLKQGQGIRVFSRPDVLKEWLATQGLRLEDRASFITDAGTFVPGFEASSDGASFFVHSPFAARHDDDVFDRNTCSLVFQATFTAGGQETRVLLSADTPADVLAEMVSVTKTHNHEDRLTWDVFKLPHHCSYRSLNEDKGKDKTVPLDEVAWLFEDQAAEESIIISTSEPIPSTDTIQPPHRQAANYYKDICKGEFKVTMEHPTTRCPEPLVITIGGDGPTIEKRIAASAVSVTSRPAPRAG